MVPPRDNDTTVDAQHYLIFEVINIISGYFIIEPTRDNDTTVDAQPSLIFKVINIRSVYFIMGQGPECSCSFKALLQVQQAPILPYLNSKRSKLKGIFIYYRLRETHAATRWNSSQPQYK